jgi:hypothetical protein
LRRLYERSLVPGRGPAPARLDDVAGLAGELAGRVPPPLGYATVRDYCDSVERLPLLATSSGDLKDVQRPWMLKAIVGSVPPGGRLLEIGAGEPLVAGHLARLGYDVTVVDPYDGRDRGPSDPRALAEAYPELRLVEGLFPDAVPRGECFDCIYSISVLEHIPLDTVEATCASIGSHLEGGGCTIHAVDHVLLGPGDADHRERLGLAAAALGFEPGELDGLFDRLASDPDAYFLSAEAHNRWRGTAPYDEFPMRRCVSIQFCAPAARVAA